MPGDEQPLSALAGTWSGAGHGEYPTISGFDYREELTVLPVPGRPIAHWRSTTRDAPTGEPRHAESGFLRATGRGFELVVAHSFGIVEVATGSFDGSVLALSSTGLIGSPSAKQVDQVERRYQLDGDALTYTIAMAAVGVTLTHHLDARLSRQ